MDEQVDDGSESFDIDTGGEAEDDESFQECFDVDEGSSESSRTGMKVGIPDVDYFQLLPDQIFQYMTDNVEQMRQILQISATGTRLLLGHFKWDKERVTDRFYEDKEKLLEEAHVAGPVVKSSSSIKMPAPKKSKGKTKKVACGVCLLTMEPTKMKSTSHCQHLFCEDCWCGYFISKITDTISSKIECPEHECGALVEDDFVQHMISDQGEEINSKYHRWLTNSFVDADRCIRWCPHPGCTNAIRANEVECMSVLCKSCGTNFCFLCAQPWHDPAPCDLLRKWLKKASDDSETCNWMSANTKDCPKCHAVIEKSGGCNHMSCTKCNHQFCWMCLGLWIQHNDNYKCNSYSASAAATAKLSRQLIERYLFYYNYFVNHKTSMELEVKLNGSIAAIRGNWFTSGICWAESTALAKAIDILQQCRLTLTYTYVFAFYLTKDNVQTDIFEGNQRDLQHSVETLSGHLERDVNACQTTEEMKAMIRKVQDRAVYSENRRRALLDHINEGNEKNTWEFRS